MKIKLIQPAMIQRPMDTKLKTRMAPSLALLTLANLTPKEHEVIIENEQIDCYNIICTDRTNKKKIENLYNNLNNQIDEYDAIFENVHSGIALIDLDGNFVKLNSKMSELLGFTSD